MLFGISTYAFEPAPFEPRRHLPLLRDAGFNCIELNCHFGTRAFAWDDRAAVQELLQVAGDTGIEVLSIHAACSAQPLHRSTQLPQTVATMRRFADLAAELGAGVVVVHAGLDRTLAPTAAGAALRRALQELEQHVLGLPCRFGWENVAAPELALTAMEQRQWLDSLSSRAFGLVYDNGQAHRRGDVEAFLSACRGRLIGLHVNDNDGVRDLHQIPGRGTFCWDRFVPKLEDAGYNGPLMLEVTPAGDCNDVRAFLNEARAAAARLRAGTL